MADIDDQTVDDVNTDVDDKGGDDKGTDNSDAMQDLLSEHGFASVEDMTAELGKSQELREELGDRDVTELIAHSDERQSWIDKWDSEKEAKLKEDEDPEDTIIRLEKDIKARDKANREADSERNEQHSAKKAIDEFESNVTTVLDVEAKDFSKEERQFLDKFLGIGNKANEIDISNKSEVRKMAKDGVKAFRDLQQVVMKNHKKGKEDIPNITSSDDSPITTPDKDKGKKTIMGQGKVALERILAARK